MELIPTSKTPGVGLRVAVFNYLVLNFDLINKFFTDYNILLYSISEFLKILNIGSRSQKEINLTLK